MALRTAPAPIAPLRSNLALLRGRRGVPETVSMRRTDALAPALEGIALADDVIAAMERVHLAVATDAPMAALHEAGRLSFRAQRCRTELRRLAGVIDGGIA
ncbi:MAG: hypothetical protein ACYDCI_05715 [Candidatus Limnocylindrales bacterium]